jgi:deazaflavin-dependent oxidoreductase (nitroreductase family)
MSLAQNGELAGLLRFPPDRLRAAFKVLNKFMVTYFRLGLGPYVGGNPYTGYIMVLTTIGRRSGMPRRTPVNYLRGEREVYCLVGFGHQSDWYRNLLANPNVQVWTGRQAWAGRAEVMADPAEWMPIYRQVARRAGFADRAFTKEAISELSDDRLLRVGSESPVMRIRLDRELPRSEGPCDLAWMWPVVGGALLAGCLVARSRARRRGG